jgi:hypothetical protein
MGQHVNDKIYGALINQAFKTAFPYIGRSFLGKYLRHNDIEFKEKRG